MRRKVFLLTAMLLLASSPLVAQSKPKAICRVCECKKAPEKCALVCVPEKVCPVVCEHACAHVEGGTVPQCPYHPKEKS